MSAPSDPLEILYEGYFYDVTDFIKRHPGGNVIRFYTEKGEDATQAIQQFHNRSSDKVHSIMKSFKKRPASENEVGLDAKKQMRHRALTDDFAKLYVEIQKEGLFEPSYIRIAWRLFEAPLFWATGIYLVFSPNFFVRCLGSLITGIGSGRAGWMMHEGGHNSATGNPKVDKLIQSVYLRFFIGLSGGWWNRRHNRHHAMPQRLKHDVDLDTMPFLAHNTKVVKDPKPGNNFFVQNQSWMFVAVDCLIVYYAWQLVISPRNAWKRRDYFDLFMMSLHWIVTYSVCSQPGGIIFVILTAWVGSTYMFGNFALSHTHLPITDEHTHWVEYALVHTANIKSSVLVDWGTGYLNFQIEHHLFPTLPPFKSYLVKDRVKALARKYDLPYHTYSFWEAWGITLKNFRDVASELKSAAI